MSSRLQPSFSALGRESLVSRARQELFDVVVVGGGITGCGVARDAALRGLAVALLEKDDIAAGTSSRSSRLIHGGLRYLEKYQLGLVHESVTERWRLLRLAPHLVWPLPFLFPVYEGDHPGLTMLKAGTLAYSVLSAFRTPGPRSSLSAEEVAAAEPGLCGDGLLGAAQYFDCQTDDARLTLEAAMDAVLAGAALFPHACVTGIDRGAQALEVTVEDRVLGTTWRVQGRTAVVAAGPWTDQVLPLAQVETQPWLRPSKGVHLLFRSERLPLGRAVVMKSGMGDRRITFAVPWGAFTYVGTTDTYEQGVADEPVTSRADADYLLSIANRYFPAARLSATDVAGVWAGLRPLVVPGHEVPQAGQELSPSDVSREERVELLDGRIVVVAGGKLTTWRRMAQRVVDRVAGVLSARFGIRAGRCATCDRPLPGARNFTSVREQAARLASEHPALPVDWLESLACRYGAQSGVVAAMTALDRTLLAPLPGCGQLRLAEVVHAARHEHVVTPADFLVRRTQALHRSPDRGLSALPVVEEQLVKLGVIDGPRARAGATAYRALATGWCAGLGLPPAG